MPTQSTFRGAGPERAKGLRGYCVLADSMSKPIVSEMVLMSQVAMVLGRCLIAMLFLFSGQGKVRDFAQNRDTMVAYGLPFATSGLIAGTTIELLGGALLVAGVFVTVVAIVLALYVVAASLLIPARDLADKSKRADAAKLLASNVAIVGGLLYVFGVTIR